MGVEYATLSLDRLRILMDMTRWRRISQATNFSPGAVAYWMQRDVRIHDNWALLEAQQRAERQGVALVVIFNVVPHFLGAARRQYGFMLRGLQEVAQELARYRIPLYVLRGNPAETIPYFIQTHAIGTLIVDTQPLRVVRTWKQQVVRKITIPCYEVDAHSVIPVWLASSKPEFSARTIRPKINRLLPEFLTEFPPLQAQSVDWPFPVPTIQWGALLDSLAITHLPEVTWLTPGAQAARDMLNIFIDQKLPQYAASRNDPNADVQSNLSPYLHFGHISAQRVALEVLKTPPGPNQEAFLEELIIRRELAENFCHYNLTYDSFAGFPAWAQKTLQAHRADPREYVYTREEFEQAKTHDALWNTAQREMVQTGKMHGYMRMYWAKKILEWSATPEDALATTIFLNDTYELDGRDPNGYAGIAWSIGGVHDRPWFDRPIFGSIRYMNAAGLHKKFVMAPYLNRFQP